VIVVGIAVVFRSL